MPVPRVPPPPPRPSRTLPCRQLTSTGRGRLLRRCALTATSHVCRQLHSAHRHAPLTLLGRHCCLLGLGPATFRGAALPARPTPCQSLGPPALPCERRRGEERRGEERRRLPPWGTGRGSGRVWLHTQLASVLTPPGRAWPPGPCTRPQLLADPEAPVPAHGVRGGVAGGGRPVRLRGIPWLCCHLCGGAPALQAPPGPASTSVSGTHQPWSGALLSLVLRSSSGQQHRVGAGCGSEVWGGLLYRAKRRLASRPGGRGSPVTLMMGPQLTDRPLLTVPAGP